VESAQTGAGWELTEHTADVGIHAWGPSAAAVFEQAALAMLSLIVDVSAVEPADERDLEAESPELDLLLAAFLNELLYLIEAGRFVPAVVRVEEPARRPAQEGATGAVSWHARAQVRGEAFDPARHRVRTVVKAATLHGLSLTEASGRWQAAVVVDV
jgi:SHS2 domain-containing protein